MRVCCSKNFANCFCHDQHKVSNWQRRYLVFLENEERGVKLAIEVGHRHRRLEGFSLPRSKDEDLLKRGQSRREHSLGFLSIMRKGLI